VDLNEVRYRRSELLERSAFNAHVRDADLQRRDAEARCYFPLQQQQPPQSSPLQQHFSQQQDSPQQSQQAPAAAALAGAGFPPKNGNTARTIDDSFMTRG